jgi:signal transduction histidine kinase
MRGVLMNLCLNAVQAIVRDGTVTVRTRWQPAGGLVVVEVTDTGPGIAEEIRAQIFEPFVSTKPGGGGLGLAIARQIAEEHSGKISYETGPNGTTFRVELPFVVTP